MARTKKDTNQILIEAAIHGSMRGIERAPERTIRNLVDLALNFSNGRFQRNFLTNAQTMLKNKKSAYYDLLRNAIADADHDTLATFGLNVGYIGCTKGGRQIRAIKEEQRYNVPWTMSLVISGASWAAHRERYFSAVDEARQIGTHVFLLHAADAFPGLEALVKEYEDCAFVLFVAPEQVTPPWLDAFEPLHNLMIAVNTAGNYPTACELLRNRRFLYALFHAYSPADAPRILDGSWTESMRPVRAYFLFFQPETDVPLETRVQVYQYITDVRKLQSYPAFLMDLTRDSVMIDRIISENSRTVTFLPDGSLRLADGNALSLEEERHPAELNLFSTSVSDILRTVLAV